MSAYEIVTSPPTTLLTLNATSSTPKLFHLSVCCLPICVRTLKRTSTCSKNVLPSNEGIASGGAIRGPCISSTSAGRACGARTGRQTIGSPSTSTRATLGITDTTVLYDNGQPESMRYIVGVLNSRVLTARFRFIGKLLGGGVLEYYENTVSQLPLPRRAPGDPQHDRMVELVQRREEAEIELRSTFVGEEQEQLTAQCANLDAQIEALVAELFHLTSEEVAILTAQMT